MSLLLLRLQGRTPQPRVGGWPGTGSLLPPAGNSDVSHESDHWLTVQATFGDNLHGSVQKMS